MSAPALSALLLAFVKARKELLAANGSEARTTAIVFDGDAYFFKIDANGVGVSATKLADVDPTSAPQAPAAPSAGTLLAEPAKKRGRPATEKAETTAPVPGPGSAPAPAPVATTTATAPAPEGAKAISKDEFRAFARAASLKLGVEAIKGVLKMPIDNLTAESYAGHKAEIERLIEEKNLGL